MTGGLILNALRYGSGGGGSSIAPKPSIITNNGTYHASSDNLDGYSSVTVDVPSGGTAIDKIEALPTVFSIPVTDGYTLQVKKGNPFDSDADIRYNYVTYSNKKYHYLKYVRTPPELLFACLYHGGTLLWADKCRQGGGLETSYKTYSVEGSYPWNYKLYLMTEVTGKAWTFGTPTVTITWIDANDHDKGATSIIFSVSVTQTNHEVNTFPDGSVLNERDINTTFTWNVSILGGFLYDAYTCCNTDVSLLQEFTDFLKSFTGDDYIIDEFY